MPGIRKLGSRGLPNFRKPGTPSSVPERDADEVLESRLPVIAPSDIFGPDGWSHRDSSPSKKVGDGTSVHRQLPRFLDALPTWCSGARSPRVPLPRVVGPEWSREPLRQGPQQRRERHVRSTPITPTLNRTREECLSLLPSLSRVRNVCDGICVDLRHLRAICDGAMSRCHQCLSV